MQKLNQGLRRWVLLATGIHLVSALVFLLLLQADLEGCDSGDSAALAFAMALALDLFLSLAFIAGAIVKMKEEGKRILVGWAISLIPAALAAIVAIAYIDSLGSGCPV